MGTDDEGLTRSDIRERAIARLGKAFPELAGQSVYFPGGLGRPKQVRRLPDVETSQQARKAGCGGLFADGKGVCGDQRVLNPWGLPYLCSICLALNRTTQASVLPPRLQGRPDAKTRAERLAELAKVREGFIRYADDRLHLDEDWHALSDVANDLRELDVEIRMLEAQR